MSFEKKKNLPGKTTKVKQVSSAGNVIGKITKVIFKKVLKLFKISGNIAEN